MSKIVLISDTHWGCRGDSPVFAKHIARFYNDVFFPYIDSNNINFIFHLGDIVDRRKYINFLSAKALFVDFINPIKQRKKFLHAIIGNHDTFYKNTNEINSMDILYGATAPFNYYSDPTEITIDGCRILLMPWICSSNYDKCIESIKNSKAQILFGHLELSGFEMYKGSVINHGYDPKLFEKFDVVCSGHFHHKSSKGNIHYLGCPYEMTWSDFDDPKGFHVFDTDTRELTFVENPNKIFHKLFYNDVDQRLDYVMDQKFDYLKDSIVKVVVKNKTNPHMFDLYIEKLEKAGTADIQVVEDHLNLDLEGDEDILDEAEDTLTILKKYAQQVTKQDTKELQALLQDLYSEALMVE